MEQPLVDVLREAIRTRQRKEDLDRSVGRAVRRREMDFKIYVQIMSELREVAKEKKISVEDAAERLLPEKEQGDKQNDRKHHTYH